MKNDIVRIGTTIGLVDIEDMANSTTEWNLNVLAD